jgi:hypothetical protein
MTKVRANKLVDGTLYTMKIWQGAGKYEHELVTFLGTEATGQLKAMTDGTPFYFDNEAGEGITAVIHEGVLKLAGAVAGEFKRVTFSTDAVVVAAPKAPSKAAVKAAATAAEAAAGALESPTDAASAVEATEVHVDAVLAGAVEAELTDVEMEICTELAGWPEDAMETLEEMLGIDTVEEAELAELAELEDREAELEAELEDSFGDELEGEEAELEERHVY